MPTIDDILISLSLSRYPYLDYRVTQYIVYLRECGPQQYAIVMRTSQDCNNY